MLKLRQDRGAKALARKADDKKGVPDLLWTNLTYLLYLGQVSAHEDLPPICKELSEAPKREHLTTLQRALDYTSHRLSIHAHIVPMPGLLKITLALGFCLDHQDDLGMGLHQFGLSQHTSAARKVLKARADQHQVIAGSGATP